LSAARLKLAGGLGSEISARDFFGEHRCIPAVDPISRQIAQYCIGLFSHSMDFRAKRLVMPSDAEWSSVLPDL
jgi:hypothetical protein